MGDFKLHVLGDMVLDPDARHFEELEEVVAAEPDDPTQGDVVHYRQTWLETSNTTSRVWIQLVRRKAAGDEHSTFRITFYGYGGALISGSSSVISKMTDPDGFYEFEEGDAIQIVVCEGINTFEISSCPAWFKVSSLTTPHSLRILTLEVENGSNHGGCTIDTEYDLKEGLQTFYAFCNAYDLSQTDKATKINAAVPKSVRKILSWSPANGKENFLFAGNDFIPGENNRRAYSSTLFINDVVVGYSGDDPDVKIIPPIGHYIGNLECPNLASGDTYGVAAAEKIKIYGAPTAFSPSPFTTSEASRIVTKYYRLPGGRWQDFRLHVCKTRKVFLPDSVLSLQNLRLPATVDCFLIPRGVRSIAQTLNIENEYDSFMYWDGGEYDKPYQGNKYFWIPKEVESISTHLCWYKRDSSQNPKAFIFCERSSAPNTWATGWDEYAQTSYGQPHAKATIVWNKSRTAFLQDMIARGVMTAEDAEYYKDPEPEPEYKTCHIILKSTREFPYEVYDYVDVTRDRLLLYSCANFPRPESNVYGVEFRGFAVMVADALVMLTDENGKLLPTYADGYALSSIEDNVLYAVME